MTEESLGKLIYDLLSEQSGSDDGWISANIYDGRIDVKDTCIDGHFNLEYLAKRILERMSDD